MADPFPLIVSIKQRHSEIVAALTKTDAIEFDTRYQDLITQAHEHPETSAAISDDILALVRSYPAAEQVLRQADPSQFSRHLTSTGNRAERGDRDYRPTKLEDADSTTPQKGLPSMAKNPNEQKNRWTPEQILTFFKEIVTAAIGVILVVFTLVMASNTYGLVGDSTKLPAAKDLLTIMLGLAGVVLGYYFGRVPADTRAAQAQQHADESAAHAEQVDAKAQQITNQARGLIDKMQTSEAQRRAGGNAVGDGITVDELQTLRDNLNALSDLARTHR